MTDYEKWWALITGRPIKPAKSEGALLVGVPRVGRKDKCNHLDLLRCTDKEWTCRECFTRFSLNAVSNGEAKP